MRSGFLPVSGLLILLLCSVALAGPEPKPDFTQRYLFVDTFRPSTMEKEINEAAGAGYRVVDASMASTEGWGGGDQSAFLEKSAEGSEPYSYRVLGLVSGLSPRKKLMEELNAAGAAGYRLLPNTLRSREFRYQGILERAPGPPSKYEYLVLEKGCNAKKQQEVWTALAQGYRVAGISRLGIVLEKGGPGEGQEASATAVGPDSAQRFLCLDTTKMSTLRRELAEASASGYRVMAFGYAYGNDVILERAAAPPEVYQYLVLTSPGQRELDDAAVRGFRLHSASESGVLMEKPPGAPQRYQYLVVEGTELEMMREAMSRAGEQGYRAVAFWQSLTIGKGYWLMERPAPAEIDQSNPK